MFEKESRWLCHCVPATVVANPKPELSWPPGTLMDQVAQANRCGHDEEQTNQIHHVTQDLSGKLISSHFPCCAGVEKVETGQIYFGPSSDSICYWDRIKMQVDSSPSGSIVLVSTPLIA